jgi:hypothetical protein
VLRFVFTNGPRNLLNNTANSGLGYATTKTRRALEMAASIMIKRNQDLLEHRQGPATIGGNMKLIIQHLNQGIHSSLVEAECALELHSVEHLHVVGPPIVRHRLPHQLDLHPLLKLLHIFNTPKMPQVQHFPNAVHVIPEMLETHRKQRNTKRRMTEMAIFRSEITANNENTKKDG